MGATLARRGHAVAPASDGAAGWRALVHETPDLAILDVVMPGPSGLDLCRSIRADARLAGLPVVIMSASCGVGDRVRASEAGGSAFLAKPFELNDLLDMVRRSLSPASVTSNA